MKVRDDLLSMLDFGWECSRRAWKLFAQDQETPIDLEGVGLIGRDFDQLAYDLRRLGYAKPARMAFSTAFVLNGLSNQSIEFDQELAEKTSQIVSVLAEMLLELEATSHITAEEPTAIVEDLQLRWGLVLHVDDHSQSPFSGPHFRRSASDAKPIVQVPEGLAAISEELVLASETLLHRVTHDGDFPYTAALSRIHHLGTALRELVTAPISQQAEPVPSVVVSPKEVLEVEAPEPVEVVIEECTSAPELLEVPDLIDVPVEMQARHVLVIDESPFFRMLLTTAIEACGYPVSAVASLVEVQAELVPDAVVCSAGELSGIQEWSVDAIAEGGRV